ncbi:hypothetical protein [Cryobacterium sp. N21]|uniref:hypothetical protein n=1 Tax=Cryobacterium sp. N21 TaxID=2048289 RepID=UPI000CE4A466|nr:hypothetical protein [Cryobacterium sp. N21]
MSTFQDPIADADEACEALRALAHATRRFNDPAQTYDVIGNLLAARCSVGGHEKLPVGGHGIAR